MKLLVKILLIMEASGLGDHVMAQPAISTLVQRHEVTVLARKFYAPLFSNVRFLQYAQQDAFPTFKARFDKSHWLAQWSVRKTNVNRMDFFAGLIETKMPESYSWQLNPQKIEGEPYILFCPNAVEAWRSMPYPSELQAALSQKMKVVTLPRVRVYASHHDGGFRALFELIDLVYNARAVVAVDTGPLHLACAMGIPSIGLYGLSSPKIHDEYRRYNPGLKHIAIQGEPIAGCTMPCDRMGAFEQCQRRRNPYCMEHIDSQKVLGALEELL